MCGKALAGSVVGFYGLGAIGLSMAQKLEPFKPAQIIYNNRKARNDGKKPFPFTCFGV